MPTQYADPYAERIAAQRALLAQVPTPRFSQSEADQRRAENERMLQLGLLGQLSGDAALAGIGAQVFRQAQQERAPRVSDQGTYDPLSGQFALHPEVLRERQRQELERLEDRSAEGQRHAEDARQRREWEAQQRELQRQFLASQNAATRAASGVTRQAAQDARNWTVEDRMADDFNRDTKTPQAVLGAHKNLQAIANKTDAASDVALIFSYMKMLDPTSVVREGEFATAQNAAGVPDQVRNAFNRAMTGQRLNPQQRAEMLGTAGRLAAQAELAVSATADQYSAKAQRRNLNPANITGRPLMLPRALEAQQQRGAAQRPGVVKFSDLPQ